jgi:hypothetical protein
MLVPSNRDPHISTVIIAPDLAIERPGRLVTNMPLHRPLLHQCHITNINSAWRTSLPIIGTLLPCPCRTHRIRSRSIGPAPVIGVVGGTMTLARDFSSTSAATIIPHPCVAWKWRGYVPYGHIATTTLFNPSRLHCLMIHVPPCQHRVCDAMEMVSFHHHTHAPSPRLTDERRSTFKKRGDVYW